MEIRFKYYCKHCARGATGATMTMHSNEISSEVLSPPTFYPQHFTKWKFVSFFKVWFGAQTNLRNAFKFLVSLEKGLSFDERLSNTSVFQKKCFPVLFDPLYYLKTHNEFNHCKLHQNGEFNCTFKVEVFYCNEATDKQDNVRIKLN